MFETPETSMRTQKTEPLVGLNQERGMILDPTYTKTAAQTPSLARRA